MKKRKLFLTSILMASSVLCLSGCSKKNDNNPPKEEESVTFTVSFYSDGEIVKAVSINKGDKVTKFDDYSKDGYKFLGWYNIDGSLFDYTNAINSNISLFAKWEKINNSSNPDNPGGSTDTPGGSTDTPSGSTDKPSGGDTGPSGGNIIQPSDISNSTTGSGSVSKEGNIKITDVSGTTEACFVEFDVTSNATYEVKYKKKNDSNYLIAIPNSNISYSVGTNTAFMRLIDSDTARVDLFGLSKGDYDIEIVSGSNSSTCSVSVASYDRSGYAHFNYTNGVGAYNDDGTIKNNARVLYVTDDNKNTISLDYKNESIVGIGNILNSVGEKKDGGLTSNGGTPNSNNGIIRKLALDNIPLVIRFVGTVSDSGLYKSGTFDPKNSLIDGLTEYNSTGNGGTVGDNGHMARIKSGKDITLEGVGEDAIIDGWGFHYMAESAYPSLGKSFEVRNLKFINTPEDAIGMEGVQVSKNVNSKLSASVERCWVHNNEFYCPDILNPAETDKSEGDGSVDFKRGQYFTCSYNYFEGCHKTNLVGSSDDSLQYNLSYHHNYWKLCKARGPLARNANIHMYNNVFEGQTDYCMNPRANAYILSEFNLFYMCKNPQRVDSGAIKSYGDSFSSCIGEMGGTIVSDRNQIVSNQCKFSAEGIDYSKFDTDAKLSYIASGDYYLQTNVTDARKVIKACTGIVKDHGISASNVTEADISYVPSNVKPVEVNSNDSLTPGKISKTVYAFTIKNSVIATIKYDTDALSATGCLVNEAGECKLIGSGSVQLNPGTYIVQPYNFQPGDGKTLTQGTFKSINITNISFEAYNSEEYNKKMIEEFNTAKANIPSNILYNQDTYNKINSARNIYLNLSDELKAKVDYTAVDSAYTRYQELGKAYVEGLISAIGAVNENSGAAITLARSQYNDFISKCSTVSISNLNTLINAEAAFSQYAVQSCINKINSIGTVTLDSKALIDQARAEYDALTEDDQKKITNYNTLTQAEAKYESLLNINEFNASLNDVDLNSLQELEALFNSYNNLTNEEKNSITNLEKLSNAKVSYTIKLISSIGNVSMSSKGVINKIDNLYNTLTDSEKSQITNYSDFVAKKEEYNNIANAAHIKTFENGISDEFFTISGSLKTKVTATYNGVTYTNALKIESKTSITFTSNTKQTLTLFFGSSSNIKITIDGNTYTSDSNGVVEIELEAGSHTIVKKDSANLFFISLA